MIYIYQDIFYVCHRVTEPVIQYVVRKMRIRKYIGLDTSQWESFSIFVYIGNCIIDLHLNFLAFVGTMRSTSSALHTSVFTCIEYPIFYC